MVEQIHEQTCENSEIKNRISKMQIIFEFVYYGQVSFEV